MRKIIFIIVLIYSHFIDFAAYCHDGADSIQINKKRLNTVIIGAGVAYTASLVALNEAWYKKQRTSFHFFNDNSEWNQVDKVGHFYSAYQLSSIGKELLLWTNMPEKKSAIWSAVMSQAFMITIDVFDGFSSEYGFSWGDITANLLGAGFFLSQELIFQEQKIKVKYSFHHTQYPVLRPEVLGNGYLEEILKDYNGHTYWLSFDIYALANNNPLIPSWINLAVGYGAEGMIYGREEENIANGYESYRQFYVGIDFDLSHVKSKSKFVNTILFFIDMIKLPAPAIEFNKHGINYHWLYY